MFAACSMAGRLRRAPRAVGNNDQTFGIDLRQFNLNRCLNHMQTDPITVLMTTTPPIRLKRDCNLIDRNVPMRPCRRDIRFVSDPQTAAIS